MNPQGVLDRGYSIVTTQSGAIVQDVVQIAVGDALGLRFARGEAAARVIDKACAKAPVDTLGLPEVTPDER